MELAAGGVIKKYPLTIVNIVYCILLLFLNIFDQIDKQQSLLQRSYITIPFIVIIAACLIFRKKYKFNAYLFLGAALLSVLTSREEGNLTGLHFLYISFYIMISLKINIFISITTIIIIASKIFLGFSAIQIMNLILGFSHGIIIYYILIHPKKPNIYTGLDEITREIIEYKMAGWSTKAVADKVFLSTDAVQKRISRACAKYEAGNLAQLVYNLMKKGYIGQ